MAVLPIETYDLELLIGPAICCRVECMYCDLPGLLPICRQLLFRIPANESLKFPASYSTSKKSKAPSEKPCCLKRPAPIWRGCLEQPSAQTVRTNWIAETWCQA